MNGFLLRELFIVDEYVGTGSQPTPGGEEICISKEKITACLNC